MKKYVAICGTLAALTWAGVAAAAVTPQGKLTGSADVIGLGNIAITTTIADGGTDPLYIGKENDKSGNCSGDSGAVLLGGTFAESIVCAHYVASSHDGSGPKMRFAIPDPFTAGCYVVFRISDGGAAATDKFGDRSFCLPDALALAQAWVNTGLQGAGLAAVIGGWDYYSFNSGDYTIIP